ncbi:MAG: TRAP transporter large permease [Lachnospiraceae bacterium]|nr:TRAP transporter large permease [Lachnospiraceae bacterium]
MSPLTIGIIGFVIFVVLMVLGLPIPIAMGVAGLVGFAIIRTPDAAIQMAISEITKNFSSYTLSVAPMFILMGFVAYESGVGGKLFTACETCFGHYRGGMAMSTTVACGIFGAICGSTPATIGTMSAVAYPEMKKAGYHPKVSCNTIAVGSCIAVMIPPSITFVMYGNACEASIGRLFMAGIVPGIIMVVLTCLAVKIHGWLDPSSCPKSEKSSWAKRWKSIRDGGLLEIAIVFCLSIGGLFAGWFTATEAGAIGSAGMIVICFIRRSLTIKKLFKALIDTGKLTAMVFILLSCASIFSRFIAVSTISTAIANKIRSWNLQGWMVLTVILVFYVIAGMLTEVLSIILLTIPVFLPILVGIYGYDKVWFGVLVILVIAIGGLTPPVGMGVFMVKGCIKDPDVSLSDIFSGVWPFLVAIAVCVVLLILFPNLAIGLPNMILG